MEHPAPGVFESPNSSSQCGAGEIQVEVFQLRRDQGRRWPMQNVGTSEESPAPGFSEQPEAFRFFFRWTEHPRACVDCGSDYDEGGRLVKQTGACGV